MKINPKFIKTVKNLFYNLLGYAVCLYCLWIAISIVRFLFYSIKSDLLGTIACAAYICYILTSAALSLCYCVTHDCGIEECAKAITEVIFDLPEEEKPEEEKPLYVYDCIQATPDYILNSLKQTCCTDFHGSTIMEQLRQSQNPISNMLTQQIYSNCPTDIMTQILDAQLRQTRDQINQTQAEMSQSIQTAFLFSQCLEGRNEYIR